VLPLLDETEIHIHVAPWEIEGVKAIWNIVMECSDTQVAAKAT
jgi:hypothetical protein